MSYSSDEKSAAVGELVQGTLSFQQDALGNLDRSTEFTEVMETVYAVLLYDPDAIYYLTYLARNSLKQIVAAELTLCDELLDAIDDLSMPNKPVANISSLASARNSLTAMDSALERSGSVAGAEFRRYQQAMTRLKAELGKTVKVAYVPRGSSTPIKDIVRPSDRAKVDVQTFFASAKTQHARLIDQLGYLQSAVPGFASGKLSAKIGQRQVVRAREQLDDLNQKLEGLTAAERIVEARDALLTVLANESVVRALAEHAPPGTAKLRQAPSSSPLYRISAHGEGTAPSVRGTVSAPFPLFDGTAAAPTDLLGFANLNGLAFDVDLFPTSSPSYRAGIVPAEVTGLASGPFEIEAPLDTPDPLVSGAGPFPITSTSNLFHIVVDGTLYECTLTTGGARTATQVKADLDNAASWKNSVQPEIDVDDTGGIVTINYDVSSPPARYSDRYMRIVNGVYYPINITWTPTSSSGKNGNDKLRIKANDDPSFVEVTLPHGSVVAASSVRSAINAAGGSDFGAELDGDRIRIVSGLSGEGSIITLLSEVPDTTSFRGMRTLGFSESQESRERDIDGSTVVALLNGTTQFSDRATARMVRQELFFGSRALRTADTIVKVGSESDPTAGWPDYTELKVAITSGDNRGVYGLTAAPSHAADALTLQLDRRLRDDTPNLQHTLTIYHEVLELESKDAGLTGAIQLDDPISGSARSVLGFDTTLRRATVNELFVESNDAVYGWRAADISRLKIRVGDVVVDAAGDIQATLSSLSQLSSGIVPVVEDIDPTFAISTAGFSIQSGAYLAYLGFINTLEAWVAGSLPPFEEDLMWIDRALARVLLTTPTRNGVDPAYSRVSQLKTALEDLVTLCDAFTVPRIAAVDSALQSLLEHGFDRARQLLITGRTSEFFSVTGGNASFSRAFQTATTAVAVQDMNRGSQARARFDSEFVRVRENWEEDQHPDYDFSDFEEEPPEDAVVDYYQGVDEFEGT